MLEQHNEIGSHRGSSSLHIATSQLKRLGFVMKRPAAADEKSTLPANKKFTKAHKDSMVDTPNPMLVLSAKKKVAKAHKDSTAGNPKKADSQTNAGTLVKSTRWKRGALKDDPIEQFD